MKQSILICMMMFAGYHCYSQNLVINGSFEQFTKCPTNVAQISNATGWSRPSDGSPDYFNSCIGGGGIVGVPQNYWGRQVPKTGNAYVGLTLINTDTPSFREYVQGSISAPLVANNTYLFQMYMNCADFSNKATDAIGVYFSSSITTGIAGMGPLPFPMVPQIVNSNSNYISDTSNWVLFSALYKAGGGEQFFIIGNFKDDFNTSTIISNTSSDQSDGYIYIDDVSFSDVTGIEENFAEDNVQISPNPFSGHLSISSAGDNRYVLKIYDVNNHIVFDEAVDPGKRVSTDQLSSGLYFYELLNEQRRQVKSGKIFKKE